MNPLRNLPPMNDVLGAAALREVLAQHGRDQVVGAVREELDALREAHAQGHALDGQMTAEAIAGRVGERLARELRPRLRAVINATGIILHTNLGRAPLAEAAALAAQNAAAGYLNLELDLESAQRSSRQDAIREWVTRLTRAESATAVNNNAAATVLVLRAVAAGKEVIISRGQLIEIGGSFRIPEIMAASGAILREVGTTNITRLADYEQAIGAGTGALLRVHTSNYRITGFTQSVALPELVALGRKHNLPVIDDIGSGAVRDFAGFGFAGEPIARESIATGADLVLFSGDKLLGGPQAGIIAGRRKMIEQLERDPLMRAFRLDKMILAALEATLRVHLDEERALRELPVLRMLATPLPELQKRAEAIATRLQAIPGIEAARATEDVAFVGGGSLPDQPMKSWVVEVVAAALSDTALAHRLRTGTPAVLARVRDGKLVLDVRTIFAEQEEGLVEAVRLAVAERG